MLDIVLRRDGSTVGVEGNVVEIARGRAIREGEDVVGERVDGVCLDDERSRVVILGSFWLLYVLRDGLAGVRDCTGRWIGEEAGLGEILLAVA